VSLLADLDGRGLIHDTTDRTLLAERLSAGPVTLYYGCDPSADSLHIGNLVGLLVLRRFQGFGHEAIGLAGGGTGMIGDPSGKSEERNLLDEETLARNVDAISAQIQRVVPEATFVDNADWLGSLSLIEFLRDVGKHATVNQMIRKESVRARMDEQGISFTEFSYMLLQAHDFYELHQRYGCELQIGGSDQWGNITAGIDLVRRRAGTSVHGLTWPLITRSDGRKFGKTEEGTIWLSAERTSRYRFFQYWINVDDKDVGRFLRQFTFLPLEEIADLEAATAEAPERRTAQRVLAREVTALVHGPDAAADAEAASTILFGSDATTAAPTVFETLAEEVPTTRVPASAVGGNLDLVDLLVLSGLASSKSEARRFREQGGVYLNNRKVAPADEPGPADVLHGRYLLLRRGKQNFALVVAD
jgi:tyrosyl-tRNA synthetase